MRPRKSPSDSTEKDRNFVTALSRGLEILRCFRKDDKSLGNRDIADRTGLSKSTVSRLTYTLHKDGYLLFDADTARYRLAPPVLSLGFSCLSGIGFRQLAKPLMQDLANYSEVPVALASRDRWTMVYLERCRSASAITLAIEVGEHIKMTTSAIGRAYIAAMPDLERQTLLDELRRREKGDWSEVQAGLDEAFECYSENGYCTSIGSWKSDVNSVAVPYYSTTTSQLFAFNCGGPATMLTKEKIVSDIGPRLIELVSEIERTSQ